MFRQSALMPKVAMTEFLLRRQLGRAFAAAGYDATVDEWAMICLLNEVGPCSLSALARANARDITTVSRMIDRLVSKGLVKRLRDPANRRSVQIALGSAGQRRFEALGVIAGAVMVQAFDNLDEDDLSTTLRALAQIEQNLRDLA
jgi:DNA-binding MarR family transcriptional regulator